MIICEISFKMLVFFVIQLSKILFGLRVLKDIPCLPQFIPSYFPFWKFSSSFFSSYPCSSSAETIPRLPMYQIFLSHWFWWQQYSFLLVVGKPGISFLFKFNVKEGYEDSEWNPLIGAKFTAVIWTLPSFHCLFLLSLAKITNQTFSSPLSSPGPFHLFPWWSLRTSGN